MTSSQGRAIALVLIALAGCTAGEDRDGQPVQPASPEVVFVSDRGGAGLDVYTHVLGSGDYTRVTSDSGSAYGPVWSPDGARILFDTDVDGQPEIHLLEVASGTQVNLTSFEGYDGGGDWSPDGAEIVFTSTRDALVEGHAGRDVWMMRADGSDLRRLTTNEMYEGAPRFSPDGSRIAFCRQLPPADEGGASNGEVFVMDRDGGNEVRVTDQPSFDCLAHWSPDGARLAFHGCAQDGCALFIAPASGGPAERIETPHPANWPVWSPDGAWIAYTATVEDQTDIWLVRPDGTEGHAVTDHPGRDEVAAWRPRAR